MNELIRKYREEIVGEDGSRKSPISTFSLGSKEVNHNVIIIDEVVVVGQIKCKEKQKVIEENLDTLTNGFRGNKPITLIKVSIG